MKLSRGIVLSVAGLVVLLSGCVERRMIIESNPPGALVYRDGVPIGATPVEVPYTYYGAYNFTLVKDGYETQTFNERISAPWYAWPPFDFVVENIYPFQVEDIRRLGFTMQPRQQISPNELLQRAENLQREGRQIEIPPTLTTSSSLPPASVTISPYGER
jgi:hypothetical protein